MPINQPNLSFFLYVDDNAVNWNVRGESGGPLTGADGHATDFTAPVWGRMTKARHVRYAEYQNATTFRKVRCIVYTPTAFAAIAPGATVTVATPGTGTDETYTLSAKIAEKQPIAKTSRHLADG